MLDVEKGDPSYMVGGNASWYSHFGKQYGGSLKIELLYDPTIALLDTYTKDTDAVKIRDTCTPMVIATMSTTLKLWKESRCPSTDEWIKMWFIYTMEYYSAIRKEEYLLFATWMELKGIMLSEISQAEKDNDMVSLIHGT